MQCVKLSTCFCQDLVHYSLLEMFFTLSIPCVLSRIHCWWTEFNSNWRLIPTKGFHTAANCLQILTSAQLYALFRISTVPLSSMILHGIWSALLKIRTRGDFVHYFFIVHYEIGLIIFLQLNFTLYKTLKKLFFQ